MKPKRTSQTLVLCILMFCLITTIKDLPSFSEEMEGKYQITSEGRNPLDIFNAVNHSQYVYWIRYLTDEIGTRPLPITSSGNTRARNWLLSTFNSFNSDRLIVEEIGGHKSVVALLPGVYHNTSNKIIVVGAHFDTVPTTKGANDNAGGVSFVLEACRVLANSGVDFNYDIYFICFNGEEQAFYGSFEMVNYFKALHKKVLICINADMILNDDTSRPMDEKQIIYHKGDRTMGRGEKYGEWGRLLERISEQLGKGYCHSEPTGEFDEFGILSDHSAFWNSNYPALFAHTIRDSQYHQPGDTLDNPELNTTYPVETTASTAVLAALTSQYGREILDNVNDTDADNLDNQLELILGTNVSDSDSDGDGFTDFYEYTNSWDPLNPLIPEETKNITTTSVTSTNEYSNESESENAELPSKNSESTSSGFINFLLLLPTVLWTRKREKY